jgi:hypothetical protein
LVQGEIGVSGFVGFIATTCKIGQGADCCRYMLIGAQGWECGKLLATAKPQLDARAALGMMTARADNCEGVADLNAAQKASEGSVH